jgi:hypothetical protein
MLEENRAMMQVAKLEAQRNRVKAITANSPFKTPAKSMLK